MSIQTGTYRLGPGHGSLSVRTGRTGAAAKAGHNLLFHVTAWEATLEVGGATSITLNADGESLRVREGTGGMQALGDDDKASIEQTVHDDVLKRHPITFRSTRVEPRADGLTVHGDLTLVGTTRPVTFDVVIQDGKLRGAVVIKQTDFGIKPYSTLFGALKVVDEVEIELEAVLPTA